MGRPRRVEEPDGIYHVTTRGNDKKPIFFGDWSGRLYLDELERAARRHGWRVIAYCLMTNHHHLLVRVPDCGLAAGMQELNGRFAHRTNKLLGRRDHLFGRRYWRKQILAVEHLLEAARYILNNPVGVIDGVTDALDWRWSSMGATVGAAHAPAFLDVGAVLCHFSETPAVARAAFADYVRDGVRRG